MAWCPAQPKTKYRNLFSDVLIHQVIVTSEQQTESKATGQIQVHFPSIQFVALKIQVEKK